MPRIDAEQPLLPSVLDRLIDEAPGVTSEPPSSRSRLLAQLKESIKRDLEWLLNTKQANEPPPPGLDHAIDSLLTFGLPDFTTTSLSLDQDQALLRRALQTAITRFEPRLSGVVVTLEHSRELDRSLRFRIDAMLRTDPDPEPVTFDSVLDLSTRAFQVRGDGS